MKDFEYVAAIAESKSISKAAELLYITQPSLSRSITNLERRLGLKLFERKSGGVELTQAGKIYVAYGREILRMQGEMEQELNALRREKMQHINVAMTLNASYMSTAAMQERIRQKYPNCKVQISNIRSVDIWEALHSQKFGFAVGPESSVSDIEGLEYEIATEEYLLLLVPQRWDLRSFAERREDLPYPWMDLSRIPEVDYILQEDTSAVKRDVDPVLQEYGLHIVPKTTTINSTLAIQAAERQLGCCFAAEVFLPFISDPAKVRPYCIGKTVKKVRTCMIYLKNRKISPLDRYCMEVVKRQLQEDYRRIAESEWCAGT